MSDGEPPEEPDRSRESEPPDPEGTPDTDSESDPAADPDPGHEAGTDPEVGANSGTDSDAPETGPAAPSERSDGTDTEAGDHDPGTGSAPDGDDAEPEITAAPDLKNDDPGAGADDHDPVEPSPASEADGGRETPEEDVDTPFPSTSPAGEPVGGGVGAGAGAGAGGGGPGVGAGAGAPDDQEMPLAAHIEEMVRRLAVVLVVMAIVSAVVFPFADRLINFLWYSFLPGSPTECAANAVTAVTGNVTQLNGTVDGTIRTVFNGTVDGRFRGTLNGTVANLSAVNTTGTNVTVNATSGLVNGTVDGVVRTAVDGRLNGSFNGTLQGAATNFTITNASNGTTGAAACPRLYHPLSLVLARLKVASLTGFVVALPVFVYESYRFMRPGLYPNERRYYLSSVPTSLVLAAIGIAFAYFLVLPVIFSYFLGYTQGAANVAFGLADTFDLILLMVGMFAFIFQIPLFVMLATMMGVASRRWLEDRRLYFWAGFAGIAFLFSPDPTGMAPFIVAVTMILLFEGTLLLLRWTGR